MPDREAGVPGPASEDAKLLTLARSAGQRAGGPGAAVRDEIGRTYAAGAVTLDALRLTPVQAAVAAAVSSGVRHLEAVALVGAEPTDADDALLRELGGPTVRRG
ncbi:MAG: cytidine deaminase [Kineosporiaceae bacterium]